MRQRNGRIVVAALVCAAASALLSCGGGGGGKPAPVATLTADATTVAVGQRVTLRWTSLHADRCTADGTWSGGKAANGSESVAVPLTQAQSTFGLACTAGSRTARVEVVVTIRPPRFSVRALPLTEAIDLNDAGDVLGRDEENTEGLPDYERYIGDPVVWTAAGMIRIRTPCPKACRDGSNLCREVCVGFGGIYSGPIVLAMNNFRTVLSIGVYSTLGGYCELIPVGGQVLPALGVSVNTVKRPVALNDAVQIVGCCSMYMAGGPPMWVNRALLFSEGQLFLVQPLESGGLATVINEAGVVAGYYGTSAGEAHVFRYENGLTADLGTLAGGAPTPRGINAAGTIVGTVQLPPYPPGELQAFRVPGGGSALEALSDLGGGQSMATGVNDLEQVVGSSTVAGAPDTWRATLLSAGTLYDLNDLATLEGVTLTKGIDINDAGQVLALGCDATNEHCRSYLLTPVEAP
jgi:probable HAF family extracellular repeat protein